MVKEEGKEQEKAESILKKPACAGFLLRSNGSNFVGFDFGLFDDLSTAILSSYRRSEVSQSSSVTCLVVLEDYGIFYFADLFKEPFSMALSGLYL